VTGEGGGREEKNRDHSYLFQSEKREGFSLDEDWERKRPCAQKKENPVAILRKEEHGGARKPILIEK